MRPVPHPLAMQQRDLLVQRHLLQHQIGPLLRAQALVHPRPRRLLPKRHRAPQHQTSHHPASRTNTHAHTPERSRPNITPRKPVSPNPPPLGNPPRAHARKKPTRLSLKTHHWETENWRIASSPDPSPKEKPAPGRLSSLPLCLSSSIPLSLCPSVLTHSPPSAFTDSPR